MDIVRKKSGIIGKAQAAVAAVRGRTAGPSGERPVIEGWLTKRAVKSGKNWRKRWVRLYSDRLVYATGNSRISQIKGEMKLTSEFYVGDCTLLEHAFLVSDFSMTYYLACSDNETKLFWMHTVARVLSKLQAADEAPAEQTMTEEEQQAARLAAYQRSRQGTGVPPPLPPPPSAEFVSESIELHEAEVELELAEAAVVAALAEETEVAEDAGVDAPGVPETPIIPLEDMMRPVSLLQAVDPQALERQLHEIAAQQEELVGELREELSAKTQALERLELALEREREREQQLGSASEAAIEAGRAEIAALEARSLELTRALEGKAREQRELEASASERKLECSAQKERIARLEKQEESRVREIEQLRAGEAKLRADLVQLSASGAEGKSVLQSELLKVSAERDAAIAARDEAARSAARVEGDLRAEVRRMEEALARAAAEKDEALARAAAERGEALAALRKAHAAEISKMSQPPPTKPRPGSIESRLPPPPTTDAPTTPVAVKERRGISAAGRTSAADAAAVAERRESLRVEGAAKRTSLRVALEQAEKARRKLEDAKEEEGRRRREEAAKQQPAKKSTTTGGGGGGRAAKMAAMWNKKVDGHSEGQKKNPFSGGGGASAGGGLKRGDAGYGQAPEGSKTAERAAAAKVWVEKEVTKLCDQIRKMGRVNDDGKPCTTFGELFEAYQDISDTLVGILIRAKKRKAVKYDGVMLFQGVHSHVVITLMV